MDWRRDAAVFPFDNWTAVKGKGAQLIIALHGRGGVGGHLI